MNSRECLLVLCLGVVLSARLTMALGGFEMELLMTKLDFLQDRLQEVEQTMKTTIQGSLKEINQASKERHVNLQNQLAKLEKDAKERIEKLDSKLETTMHEMEQSLKKQVTQSVKTSEGIARAKLEDLENLLIGKIEHIKYHQIDQSKTYQETSQAEFEKLGKNQNTLEMLTDSVRTMSNLSEKSVKILEAHFMYPVRSCQQVMKLSGRYFNYLEENVQPFEVFCEQNKFGGGWTVIQHRFDGSVDFYRNWTEYRNGFGRLDGEFWLGLEYVHQFTKNRPHELLVEVKDFHGNYGYAKYDEFEIGNEAEMYELKKLGTYSGTAKNALGVNRNEKFTTLDRDNDKNIGVNCAKDHHGAWWHYRCTNTNLNGLYQNTTGDESAMFWYFFKNDYRGLSYSRMMIRDIIN